MSKALFEAIHIKLINDNDKELYIEVVPSRDYRDCFLQSLHHSKFFSNQ